MFVRKEKSSKYPGAPEKKGHHAQRPITLLYSVFISFFMFSFSIFIYFSFHRGKYMYLYALVLSSFVFFFYFYFIYLFIFFSCWQVHVHVLELCMCYLFLRRHAPNMYLLRVHHNTKWVGNGLKLNWGKFRECW